MSSCPLCQSDNVSPYAHEHGRTYVGCGLCGLIFVPPHLHPDPQTERRRYETHNNDPSSEGYRDFLRRAASPLLKRIKPPAHGLDYGAGPGPTLSVLLEEHGFDMSIYDPFFARLPDLLKRSYDFITCTEAAEHFHDPSGEFERLNMLLRPGGWLAVMTEWADDKNFERWSYARDVTHVSFYRSETMVWLAGHFDYRLDVPRHNVALFQKAAAT